MKRPAVSYLAMIFLLPLAGALGCGGEEAPPAAAKKHNFTLEVDVTDAQQNPLPQVGVTVDGKMVGHTDADGKFTAILSEFAGKPLTLAAVAPDGYRFPPDTNTVTEMLRVTSVNGQESGVPVFLSSVADSLEKDYFVWVKAACDNGCDDWPVLLDGEEVGRTNALGYAHFAFTNQPGREVELEIRSSGKYQPANPKYVLELELDSTVYRVEQPFSDPNKPKKRARRPAGKRGKKSGKKAAKKVPGKGEFVDPTPPPKEEHNGIDLFGP